MFSKVFGHHIPVDIASMRKSDFLESQEQFERKKLEYIEKGHGWKPVERCPVCGSGDYEHELDKDGIPLVKCSHCELRFHTKVPADPNDVYQASDYVVYLIRSSDEHFNYRRERFGRERIKLLERHCGDLSAKTLLDVGCGEGWFLSAAAQVCKRCVGSELSVHLRESAHERTGLTIHGEPLDTFPERDFDIITVFDVIEHILEPVPFMRAAANLLAPGGYILLYTPNIDSFSVRVMKEHSSLLGATEHVILFTHGSLKILGETVGLEVVHTETHGLDVHSIMAYQSYKGEEISPFLSQWVDELQAMIDACECADYLRIIYRKP